MKTQLFVLISLCLSIVIPCQAKIIYVDDDAPAGGNGSSWGSAYKHLQDALQEPPVSGDEIWVGEGTYMPDANDLVPDGTGDREATFQLISGVALMGGYAGVGEVDPNSRDWELHETVLSGDLEEDDLPDFVNYEENVYHVVTSSSVGESTIIDGFVITSGSTYYLNTNVSFGGAGIYSSSSSCQIKNCKFTRNFDYPEGPTGTNTVGGTLYGGGAPTITNCLFLDNRTRIYGTVFIGAGKIKNCIFQNNYSSANVSGIFFLGGNSAIENCVFISGSRSAIGLYNNTVCKVSNCVITNYQNRSGIRVYTGDLTLSNTIMVSNNVNLRLGYPAYPSGAIANISYCNIQSGESSITIEPDGNGTLNYLNGNIDTDPNFIDPANNDYHLQSQAGHYDPTTQTWIKDSITSPCIDAGDPTTSIGWEPYPNGGVVNMGAYGATTEASKSYFGTTPCETPIVGDINGDCRVGMIDFGLMSLHWLEDNNL